DLAVFHFDEVADVDILTQFGARAQARIRADLRLRADHRVLDMAERLDGGAGADGGVDEHAMRADFHAVGQFDPAFEDAADVDHDIAPADQFAAHVEAGRVHQGDAALEQRV